jgi:hypothetical protein
MYAYVLFCLGLGLLLRGLEEVLMPLQQQKLLNHALETQVLASKTPLTSMRMIY